MRSSHADRAPAGDEQDAEKYETGRVVEITEAWRGNAERGDADRDPKDAA